MKNVIKVLIVISILLTSACNSGSSDISVSQEKINYRDVLVDLNNFDKDYDQIKIIAKMYYKRQLCQQHEYVFNKDDITDNKLSFEAPYYGEYNIETNIIKNNKTIKKYKDTVAVVAEHYNIAPLIATTPVLIYSLKYFYEIPTQLDNGDPIPNIVILARDNQYDWNNLPENMYACPYLNENDKGKRDFDILNVQMPKIKAYVAKLKELNPESTYTFYTNDQHSYSVIIPLVYENNLDPDKYQLRFITDGGSTSYNIFRSMYDNTDDASSVHEEAVATISDVIDKIRNNEKVDDNFRTQRFARYIYALLDVEQDAQWWVIRKSAGDTFKIQDEEFLQTVIDDPRVSNNYINNLLASVQEAGKEDELKKLYKFEDEVFVKAQQENKKAMMILGTSKGIEDNYPIDNYFKATKKYYGDDYEYIYKGHPGNLPDEKTVQHLNDLGMEVVDASIAAEIFMFYHPELSLSGYPSTTYVSSISADNNFALYFVNKDRAYNEQQGIWSGAREYAETFDIFISDLKISSDEALGDLKVDNSVLNLVDNKDHDYYLLEFNEGKQFDLGLYDLNDDKLFLYKLNNGNYELVETR